MERKAGMVDIINAISSLLIAGTAVILLPYELRKLRAEARKAEAEARKLDRE